MKLTSRGRAVWIAVSIVVIVAILLTTLYLVYPDRIVPAALRPSRDHLEPQPAAIPAPRDLAQQRASFVAGIEALQRNDPHDAIRHFHAIDFGDRAVEQYRLYFLATAHQLSGNAQAARLTLAKLWSETPELVYRDDTGFNLGALYAAQGAWRESARIYASLSSKASPAVAASARSEMIRMSFHAGDPGAILFAARSIIINNPKSKEAAAALDLERSLRGIAAVESIPLSIQDRVVRGENLLRDGDASSALRELQPINAEALGSPLRERILLARGEALQKQGRHSDAIATVTPLFSGHYKHAINAIHLAARSHRALAAAINPTVTKTVKQKQRAGTRKVKRKGKTVRVPNYKTVTKTVKLVNLQLKKKKDEHERLYVERLKDLLSLPTPPAVREEVLNAMIARAAEKNQDAYMRELIPQLVKISPSSDPGLQRFWDKGWAAYQRGDHATARQLFQFIESTYRNPNTQRQARYWYARSLERSGEKKRAAEIYEDLVSVPYQDLYGKFAAARGAKPRKSAIDTRTKSPDWTEYADREMPDELRLAYELSALGVPREARAEVQANANRENRALADAILADVFYAEGALELGNRFARRAFPDLATVEQDQVPEHFVRMYYPLRFEKEIREEAAKRKLDPYLVMALIRQESAFDPDARSRVGATGLMQIMPATGRELGARFYRGFTEARLRNPEVNIELGTYYLRQVIDLLGGNVELALAGYNGGPYRIKRWREANRRKPLDEFIEGIPLAESRNYVKRITLLRSTYEEMYGDR